MNEEMTEENMVMHAAPERLVHERPDEVHVSARMS